MMNSAQRLLEDFSRTAVRAGITQRAKPAPAPKCAADFAQIEAAKAKRVRKNARRAYLARAA